MNDSFINVFDLDDEIPNPWISSVLKAAYCSGGKSPTGLTLRYIIDNDLYVFQKLLTETSEFDYMVYPEYQVIMYYLNKIQTSPTSISGYIHNGKPVKWVDKKR